MGLQNLPFGHQRLKFEADLKRRRVILVVWTTDEVNIGGLEWVTKANSERENTISLDTIITISKRCTLT